MTVSTQIFAKFAIIVHPWYYSIAKEEFAFIEEKKILSPEQILYISSNLHKLTFYVMEDSLKEYTMYMTLDDMESKLSNTGFLRIHQRYLVNISHVKKIIRYS